MGGRAGGPCVLQSLLPASCVLVWAAAYAWEGGGRGHERGAETLPCGEVGGVGVAIMHPEAGGRGGAMQ